MKINLLVIKTNQIHELAKFYTLLGCNFEYHKHQQGIYHYSTEYNGLVFEIYPLPKSVTQPDQTTRLGFEIEHFDEVLTFLKSKNIKFLSEPYLFDNKRVVIIEDLDGRKIELSETV